MLNNRIFLVALTVLGGINAYLYFYVEHSSSTGFAALLCFLCASICGLDELT